MHHNPHNYTDRQRHEVTFSESGAKDTDASSLKFVLFKEREKNLILVKKLKSFLSFYRRCFFIRLFVSSTISWKRFHRVCNNFGISLRNTVSDDGNLDEFLLLWPFGELAIVFSGETWQKKCAMCFFSLFRHSRGNFWWKKLCEKWKLKEGILCDAVWGDDDSWSDTCQHARTSHAFLRFATQGLLTFTTFTTFPAEEILKNSRICYKI